MSTRTLLEINHDYLADILDNPEAIATLRRALSMGAGPHYPMPYGVTWLGQRHHSDPPFMPYDQQRDVQHQIERLRAGKRVVRRKQSLQGDGNG